VVAPYPHLRGRARAGGGGRDHLLRQVGRADDARCLQSSSGPHVACSPAERRGDLGLTVPRRPFLDEGAARRRRVAGISTRGAALRPGVLLPGHGRRWWARPPSHADMDLLSELLRELLAVTREEMQRGGSVAEIRRDRADRRLARYHRRRDLVQYTVSQRFAIYRCLNNMTPERTGRGWWHDLRPSVAGGGERRARHALLAESTARGGGFAGLAARARRLGRRRRPEALALVAAYRQSQPADARGAGAGLRAAARRRPGGSGHRRRHRVRGSGAAGRAARRWRSTGPSRPRCSRSAASRCSGRWCWRSPWRRRWRRSRRRWPRTPLPRAQRRKGEFFLGKAHQMEGDHLRSGQHYRRALPGWARPLYRCYASASSLSICRRRGRARAPARAGAG
jgi:hypothetical protein